MKRLFRRIFRKFNKFRKNQDSNVNILIECIAIIMIWRGVWDLLEIYIFPDSPLISNILCVILWVGILLLDDWKLWELKEEDHHRWKRSS